MGRPAPQCVPSLQPGAAASPELGPRARGRGGVARTRARDRARGPRDRRGAGIRVIGASLRSASVGPGTPSGQFSIPDPAGTWIPPARPAPADAAAGGPTSGRGPIHTDNSPLDTPPHVNGRPPGPGTENSPASAGTVASDELPGHPRRRRALLAHYFKSVSIAERRQRDHRPDHAQNERAIDDRHAHHRELHEQDEATGTRQLFATVRPAGTEPADEAGPRGGRREARGQDDAMGRPAPQRLPSRRPGAPAAPRQIQARS